jgi:hypothetical protein
MRQHRFEFEMIMMVGVLAAALPAFGLSHCAFQRAGDTYTGGCGPLFDQTPAMTLAREAAITTGVWSTDVRPTSAWIGTMTDDGDTDSLELEIDAGGSGVLRTEYGWFAVTQFVASATMSFDLDASQEIQPNALDAEIVRRATAILSSDNVWNRADNRKCPSAATIWSIYCATEKATIEVTGGFHHRRPALETVREIVDQRTQGRPYHHRLMDYNNDPSTQLSDVESLFSAALRQIERANSRRRASLRRAPLTHAAICPDSWDSSS